ncbi:MAG TPA: NAD(P)/FAD-dependent oxidoreductase [Longimicrobium sp.]|jgi:flavin-dependent dehydrogenase|uniref:NAD(P)/FAD-dependent oxidoreductase n=1 Tax=Longimicrobium sp. TaxID=2029185 RepID=UPI002ED87972
MTWDAIVVGGGPAGSTTAALLASDGWRVLLLDRARFPRRKPCAECINPAGVAALRRLGVLDRVMEAGPARLEGWRIASDGGPSFLGRFHGGVHGIALPRETLDDILLRHARACGAEVREGLKATDLLRDGDGHVRGVVAGGEEVAAKIVVGADGLRSIVLRRLGLLARAPRLRKLALTAHVRGLGDMGGCGTMRARGRRCVGVADVGGGLANVTVVVPAEQAHEVGGHADAYFDAALRESGFVDARRVDDVLATGPFDCPVRRAVADGALLVGDAAGYYDPFTGQGIYRALRGAELAAQTIGAALRAGDTRAAALMPYERARRRAFAPGERLQRVVEAFVSRPRLLRWAAGRLDRRAQLADAVIHATGDVRPVRSLLHPALLRQLVA